MKKLSHGQKIIFGEFLSNFALAWLSFGLIAPMFSQIGNINVFIVKLMATIIASIVLMVLSLNLVK
jgi:hypothetical protein